MQRRWLLARTGRWILALSACPSFVHADNAADDLSSPPDRAALERKISSLLENSPALHRGRIGFKFVDVENGSVWAERNAPSYFTPASNAKLYTTALALVRLGADYRFQTELRTTDTWRPGVDSIGGLQIVGGGDPNLSGRALPYQVDAPEGDPLAAVKELADQVIRAGIRRIDGDVTGLATRYSYEPYPDGWTLDDSLYSYGAPVSALSVNDGSAALILRPAEPGELADWELQPSFGYFIIQNEVVTDSSASAHIRVSRQPGCNELVLTGTIGRGVKEWREDVAMDDPAFAAAGALVRVLRERGVVVSGSARAAQDGELLGGTLLGRKSSQPLSEVLQIVNKVSQNLHAEMLLREVAFVRSGVGSLENGLKERDTFLSEAGVSKEASGYALADGSGLARQDLTTPDSTIALLRYMWARPDRNTWLNTFPVGGVDGSLQHRFRKIAGADRLHGKTGSLSHVNALAGYLVTRSNAMLAFSVMVNATASPEREVRDAIDRLCEIFLPL